MVEKAASYKILEPLVFELVRNGTSMTFLVEEMLEGQYQKFNNNMGYVEGKCRGGGKAVAAQLDDDKAELGDIPEDDNEDCDDKDELLFTREFVAPHGNCNYKHVRLEDFPLAFSHFSYERSKKRIMVVDLQGVLQVNADGAPEYVLTDPAIHKRHRQKLGQLRLGHFGRTDRGEQGMKAFWASHVCTDACSLLGLFQEIL